MNYAEDNKLSNNVRLFKFQVRIDLPSKQIDSQIDSHLILEGRTETRIENRFFFDCSKGAGWDECPDFK